MSASACEEQLSLWPQPVALQVNPSSNNQIPVRQIATKEKWHMLLQDTSVLQGCEQVIERAFQRFLGRVFAFHEHNVPDYTATQFLQKPFWNILDSSTLKAIDTVSISFVAEADISDNDNKANSNQCNATTGKVLSQINRLGIDESYEISILENQSNNEINIFAKTVIGVIRAFSRLSQLVTWTGGIHGIPCTPLRITDYPRFAWRGLMVDTSRHYFPLATLRRILNGMELLHLNVFHWHIVDAQSFPFQSLKYPLLSEKGAFHRKFAVYNQADITDLIHFAADRGIRVVPEFDIPAHTASWGLGYPDLTVNCPHVSGEKEALGADMDHMPGTVYSPLAGMLEKEIDKIALHPTNAVTFLSTFLTEVFELFPDEYIHLGGDEVNAKCWKEGSDVAKAMGRVRSSTKLHGEFTTQILPLLLKHGKHAIFWDEAVSLQNVSFPLGTIIQFWRNQNMLRGANRSHEVKPKAQIDNHSGKRRQRPQQDKRQHKDGVTKLTAAAQKKQEEQKAYLEATQQTMLLKQNGGVKSKVLEYDLAQETNAKPILSRPFYLDHLSNDWYKWYTEDIESTFIGAEACSWSENANDNNVDERIFGRLPVMAELLWSPATVVETNRGDDRKSALTVRLDRTLCRLRQRYEISVASVQTSGYCRSRNHYDPLRHSSSAAVENYGMTRIVQPQQNRIISRLFHNEQYHEPFYLCLQVYFPIWFAVGLLCGYVFSMKRKQYQFFRSFKSTTGNTKSIRDSYLPRKLKLGRRSQ